jgi:hypothetical protein
VVIAIEPLSRQAADVRIEVSAYLDGIYWVGASGGSPTIRIAGDAPIAVAQQRELELSGHGEVSVQIDATTPSDGLQLVFVRRDTIEPARPFPAPPETPP